MVANRLLKASLRPAAAPGCPGPVDQSLISVIIPAYNSCNYISDAIDSALAQTYQPTEVIVIDDGSSDGTAEVARGYGARVLVSQVAHGGESLARNQGIALARGNYIAFLDADDLWLKNKLALQMRAFAADPALDLVFGHVEHFVSPELDPSAVPRVQHLMRLMPGLLPSLMLARRSVFDRAGLFESQWRAGPFVDWYLRAMDRGLHGAVLPVTLARRRLHLANSTRAKSANYVDYVRVLKASLDRRRAVAAE